MTTRTTRNTLPTLLHEQPLIPLGAEVMTALVELPPGDPGSPPHRHLGPVFGYVIEGELRYETRAGPSRWSGPPGTVGAGRRRRPPARGQQPARPPDPFRRGHGARA